MPGVEGVGWEGEKKPPKRMRSSEVSTSLQARAAERSWLTKAASESPEAKLAGPLSAIWNVTVLSASALTSNFSTIALKGALRLAKRTKW